MQKIAGLVLLAGGTSGFIYTAVTMGGDSRVVLGLTALIVAVIGLMLLADLKSSAAGAVRRP